MHLNQIGNIFFIFDLANPCEVYIATVATYEKIYIALFELNSSHKTLIQKVLAFKKYSASSFISDATLIIVTMVTITFKSQVFK